jgi:glucokinase
MTSNFEIFENVVEIHQEVREGDFSTKEEKMIAYVRELAKIEDQTEYKDAGWLTGDEISMTVKAYRMMKSETFDFDEFTNVYESLAKITGRA